MPLQCTDAGYQEMHCLIANATKGDVCDAPLGNRAVPALKLPCCICALMAGIEVGHAVGARQAAGGAVAKEKRSAGARGPGAHASLASGAARVRVSRLHMLG